MSSWVTRAAILFSAGFAGQAAAETGSQNEACAERGAIIDQLEAKYHESHRASGLQNDTKLVEIWTSQSSGSWTILVTDVNGTSCIAAAGRGWLDMEAALEPVGTAS